MTTVRRQTSETTIRVRLRGPGRGGSGHGEADVDTPDPFLEHMLETLARYAGLDLEVDAEGDLRHHVIEDVAITLGEALRREVPETCRRYADATVVMDDAMVRVALDLGGRAYYQGPLPDSLSDHFMRSLADHARMTLHVEVVRGDNRHHMLEAAVKALGLSLREAIQQGDSVFSTKGSVSLEVEED